MLTSEAQLTSGLWRCLQNDLEGSGGLWRLRGHRLTLCCKNCIRHGEQGDLWSEPGQGQHLYIPTPHPISTFVAMFLSYIS